jgi:hypothetical protein
VIDKRRGKRRGWEDKREKEREKGGGGKQRFKKCDINLLTPVKVLFSIAAQTSDPVSNPEVLVVQPAAVTRGRYTLVATESIDITGEK